MVIKNPVQIGPVLLGAKPEVVGVVDDFYDVDYFLGLSQLGVKLLELRLDLFESTPLAKVLDYFKQIFDLNCFGLIGTVREVSTTSLIRPGLFESLFPYVHIIDVEYDTPIRFRLISLARQYERLVLISDHDYAQTPSDDVISQRYQDAVWMGADVVKFAYMANTQADAVRLMQSCYELSSGPETAPLSTMSMGEHGRISRVISGAFGSCLTYGFLGETGVAPGQWPVKDLVRVVADLYV